MIKPNTKKRKKTIEEELQWYKNAFVYSRKTIHELTDHLLGEDWVACDTGNLYNTDPILIQTIKEKYQDVNIINYNKQTNRTKLKTIVKKIFHKK